MKHFLPLNVTQLTRRISGAVLTLKLQSFGTYCSFSPSSESITGCRPRKISILAPLLSCNSGLKNNYVKWRSVSPLLYSVWSLSFCSFLSRISRNEHGNKRRTFTAPCISRLFCNIGQCKETIYWRQAVDSLSVFRIILFKRPAATIMLIHDKAGLITRSPHAISRQCSVEISRQQCSAVQCSGEGPHPGSAVGGWKSLRNCVTGEGVTGRQCCKGMMTMKISTGTRHDSDSASAFSDKARHARQVSSDHVVYLHLMLAGVPGI